jgi:hypothetical protein
VTGDAAAGAHSSSERLNLYDGALPHVGASQAISTAWLIGVARHKLIDRWRRLQREDRSLQAVASSEAVTGRRRGRGRPGGVDDQGAAFYLGQH